MDNELDCDCIVTDPCNVSTPPLYEAFMLISIPFIDAMMLYEGILPSNVLYAMRKSLLRSTIPGSRRLICHCECSNGNVESGTGHGRC